jgi:hypothetical protein
MNKKTFYISKLRGKQRDEQRSSRQEGQQEGEEEENNKRCGVTDCGATPLLLHVWQSVAGATLLSIKLAELATTWNLLQTGASTGLS